MKLKYDLAQHPSGITAVKDTNEITAKRLFAMFMHSYAVADEIMAKHKNLLHLYDVADGKRKKQARDCLRDAVTDLSVAVCDAFIEFLAFCPHVHITLN